MNVDNLCDVNIAIYHVGRMRTSSSSLVSGPSSSSSKLTISSKGRVCITSRGVLRGPLIAVAKIIYEWILYKIVWQFVRPWSYYAHGFYCQVLCFCEVQFKRTTPKHNTLCKRQTNIHKMVLAKFSFSPLVFISLVLFLWRNCSEKNWNALKSILRISSKTKYCQYEPHAI